MRARGSSPEPSRWDLWRQTLSPATKARALTPPAGSPQRSVPPPAADGRLVDSRRSETSYP